MGFWNNVETECEYKNISRKELASAANFSVNTISTGLKRNGMPAADLAVRISKVLEVPLDQLLDCSEKETNNTAEKIKAQQKLFLTYLPVIEKLDSLPKEIKTSILTIINKSK